MRMLRDYFHLYFGTWRNGSATDFGSVGLGSSPGAPTQTL